MVVDRPEAVANAVRFLSDPKVKEAPLAKKIAFLEGKGVTSAEIQSALKLTGGEEEHSSSSPPPIPSAASRPQAPPSPPASAPPPAVVTTTWRSLAMTSLAFLGTSAALIWAVKTYLGPYLDLPSGVSVKKDTELIERQLTSSSKALDHVSSSTKDLIKDMKGHSSQVSETLGEMSDLLNSLQENDEKKRMEIKKIKQDVDELLATFPKLVEKTQENQTSMLAQVQAEMKSLKSLLMNRRTLPEESTNASYNIDPLISGGTAPTSHQASSGIVGKATLADFTPSFGGVNFNVKPTIPSWQLSAAAVKNNAISTPAALSNENTSSHSTSLSHVNSMGYSNTIQHPISTTSHNGIKNGEGSHSNSHVAAAVFERGRSKSPRRSPVRALSIDGVSPEDSAAMDAAAADEVTSDGSTDTAILLSSKGRSKSRSKSRSRSRSKSPSKDIFEEALDHPVDSPPKEKGKGHLLNSQSESPGVKLGLQGGTMVYDKLTKKWVTK